jgi:hypothetical protein
LKADTTGPILFLFKASLMSSVCYLGSPQHRHNLKSLYLLKILFEKIQTMISSFRMHKSCSIIVVKNRLYDVLRIIEMECLVRTLFHRPISFNLNLFIEYLDDHAPAS